MKRLLSVWLFLASGFLVGCSSLSSSSSLTLDEKLAREHQRYDHAQQLVRERYKDSDKPLNQKLISRNEWEKSLAPRPEEAFTTADLDELRARQKRRIESARAAAIKASIIDFSAWRTLPEQQSQQVIRQFCEAVPKGGMLHIHPKGSVNQKTFRTLFERSNPVIEGAQLYKELSDPKGGAHLYPDELAWLKTLPASARFLSLPRAEQDRIVQMGVLPPGTHEFERFQAVFYFILPVMLDDWNSIPLAYEDFAERAVRAGVQYVEFTEAITPEEVPKYEQVADMLAKKYGLVVRFNAAYFRIFSPESQHAAVNAMLKKMDSPVIVGIDLLASERDTPALETAQAVYGPVMAANAANGGRWRRTMHAGEHGDARNPRDALLLGAERLGHGVRLIENPVVMQYAADRRTPVEINLISNLKLRAVNDIRAHPYLTYLRLGMPVSLSTDDEGIYETDINDECVLAVGKTDLTYHEFREMAFNSLRTSFATDEVKQPLLAELKRRFDRFEEKLLAQSPPQ